MIESSLSPSEPVMLPGRPSGRVARSVLGYAIAIALMSVTIAVFVPAALFHCAIRNGRRAAWAAAGVALVLCAGYAAALAAKTPASQAVVWVSVVGAFLTIALPALAALPLVERGESFGRVLVFLLAGSIAGLALTEAGARTALAFSPYEAAIQQTKASNDQVIQLYRANKAPAEAIHVLQKASAYHLFVLPGSML
ncbi:MAG TPA: hypothetical protein VJZ00_20945, partial [Thermoanaerobaculia bacterium]|nr:hypothetical protein [Thermoanaerobaculia bacterium]